ncbi:MAG TPA: VOC family protein [Xanthobacteraceae bacterium]|nr:VOC family protein [Xanthobacteraceae bacterium]
MTQQLPDTFRLGPAALRVSDASRALDFYVNKVGLALRERGSDFALLGTPSEDLLRLDFVPGIAPRDERETGLYHIAFLLPDRPSLGAVIARLSANDVKLGAADHLVSEAIYVWDPDNNGIEIYRDRPRSEWTWRDGQVQMSNRPLDFQGLLAEPGVETRARESVKEGTRIGHIHLEVDDLAKAKEFYSSVIGFTPVSTLPGAQFLSAGGYHHHIGTNVWESRNGPPPSPEKAGLSSMTFVLPDEPSVDALRRRLGSAGIETIAAKDGFDFIDPWRTRVTVRRS